MPLGVEVGLDPGEVVLDARAQPLEGLGGPDPPKFGRTTPTFLRSCRLQSTKLGIPSVFCSVS